MVTAGVFEHGRRTVGNFLVSLGRRLGEIRLGPLDGAIVFVALYCLFQALTQPLVSYGVGAGVNIDEAEQLIYLPHLWMGYGSSQPPLYSWLTAIFCQIFGTTILSLKIVKYLIFLLGMVCVAVSVRRLGYSRGAAAAAMLGLFTIPEILWEMQRALTHSVAAFAFSAMMVMALVLLFEKRTLARYAFFGLAAGLALLAKYNDVLLLIALIAAALSVPAYRPAILDRRIVMSALITALVVFPTALWSLEHQGALLGHASKFQMGNSGAYISARLQGLGDLIVGSISFAILPFGLVIIAFATEKLMRKVWRQSAGAGAQFIGRTIVFGLSVAAVLIIASGAAEVRNRWLLPLLFLVPAYGAMRADEFDLKGREIQHFLAGVGAAIAIAAIPAIWYIQVGGGNGFSSSMRLDYPAFYRLVTADGPVSTIVGDEQWVGNFRLVEHDLVILDPQTPYFNSLIRLPAVVVWLRGSGSVPQGLLERIEKAGYAVDGAVHRLSVPEHLASKGSRDASFVRLRKIRDVPATESDAPDTEPTRDGD